MFSKIFPSLTKVSINTLISTTLFKFLANVNKVNLNGQVLPSLTKVNLNN
jgi:hypothetical protein